MAKTTVSSWLSGAESLLVYLDDNIIYSLDFSSHLQRLWHHGLRFLSHVVDQEGKHPDLKKVTEVLD